MVRGRALAIEQASAYVALDTASRNLEIETIRGEAADSTAHGYVRD